MSTHVEEELLSRFFDGEASDAEAELVATHIGDCDECEAKLSAFGGLRDGLRVLAEERAITLHSDGLFASIEREIPSRVAAVPAHGGAKVISIFRRIAPPLAIVLAAAAAIAMFISNQNSEPDGVPVADAPHGSVVEEVSYGESQSGTVFSVPNETDAGAGHVAVVWINDGAK